MKLNIHLKRIWITGLVLFSASLYAQQKISLDLAAIRQLNHNANGINFSSFYYFTDRFTGGIEMIRFFPVKRTDYESEEIQISSWDVDLNFHYLVPVYKNWKIYPITGISHISERELNPVKNESVKKHSWCFNTGAGILWQWKKWVPHIEYNIGWSRNNQQIFLTGISYELEFNHHHDKSKPSR